MGQASSPEPVQLAVPPFYQDGVVKKVIALVGPPGAGKSTTVAKLARHCRLNEKRVTGLISLDRFRIGTNSMLENVANIMDLPFSIVHDADQLQSALNDLAAADVILIDTPGMGGKDRGMLDDISALLRLARPDETHLVVNATVREEVLAATVNTFKRLDVNRLLFTHMDECGAGLTITDLLGEPQLPSSFYSDGMDLFDHLQTTTANRPARYHGDMKPAGHQAGASSSQRDTVSWASAMRLEGGDADQYVANRNSELFHHINCKSVKRINIENIVAFSTVQQALEQGFKPCRACCDVHVIRKLATENLNDQRARAI